MAKQSNLRWLGLRGGQKTGKGKRGKQTRARQDRYFATKLSGAVTTRKATPEELASLKGIPPVQSIKKTPKRGELPP